MSKTKADRCRDAIRVKLPWYVNGTLSEAEMSAVRKHIEGCADCRLDVDLHSSMRAAVLGRDVAPIVPAAKSADIIGIGRTGAAEDSRSRWRWVAVAAGMAIIGVTLLISLYSAKVDEGSNQLFETATSMRSADGIDYVLQLQFDGGLSDDERNRIAARLDGVVKWTVSDSGLYEVHVQLGAPSLEVLQAYEERAMTIAGVQSAKFTALQLPMR